MIKKIRVGIVGCGAIGGSLAKGLCRELKNHLSLVALYDINPLRTKQLLQKLRLPRGIGVTSLPELIKRSDLVVEAASATCSWNVARNALYEGRNVMIMSIGGIVSHISALYKLTKKYGGCIYLPSGAIAGIDALKAAKTSGIKSVLLTTRKNPLAFNNVAYVMKKKIPLNQIRGERVLFYGSALEAVKHFPQNINVAALLSIAGIGARRTMVKIIASSEVKENIHEIEVVSRAGHIVARTQNVLHPDNPKTSYLAVLSALAVLRQMREQVKVGT